MKRSWIGYVSLFALCMTAATLIYCGWGGEEDPTAGSVFTPEVIQSESYKPFFYSPHIFYDGSGIDEIDFKETNVREWMSFFDQKVTHDDMWSLLYRDSGIQYIDTLVAYTARPTALISDSLRRNSLNTYPDKKKRLEFLQYLRFARECEPYVTFYPSLYMWGFRDTARRPEMKTLFAEGRDLDKKIKSPFVRQRYHFQMVRLLYKQGETDACINYTTAHRAEIEGAGVESIRYRTWSYAGLAYFERKDYATANYIYSLIFDSMEVMQKCAIHYFQPMEDSDWTRTLAMARTPHERCVLWAMAGIKGHDEIRSVQKIYAAEPSSPVLDVLLVRIANLSEGTYQQYSSEPYIPADSIWREDAYRTITAGMADSRLHNKALWYLCAGFLTRDRALSDSYYSRAESLHLAGDSLMITQLHLLRMLLRDQQLTHIDRQVEDQLLADILWLGRQQAPLRTGAAISSIRDIAAALYTKAGDRTMAQLANKVSMNRFYQNDSAAMELIRFMRDTQRTPLQAYLAADYPIQPDQIWYSIGMKDIYEGDLTGARQKWAHTPSGLADDSLNGDPFIILTNDYAGIESGVVVHGYTRRSFLDRMIAMEKTAKSGKAKSAQAYFDMAAGYYNISCWGHERGFDEGTIYADQVVRYYSYTSSQIYSELGTTRASEEYPSIERDGYVRIGFADMAMKYFLKAREVSRDREFKARCTFMAAKARGGKYQDSALGADEVRRFYGDYFAELRTTYGDTRYTREVLNECTYFQNYMKHF